MFGPPGHLYVYFIYGMHWCANVVCGPRGRGQAVLIRSLAPLTGLATIRGRRPRAQRNLDLCNGPAKLCAALSITGDDNGVELCGVRGLRIVDDGLAPPADPVASPRIGIRKARDLAWRWSIAGDPNVSVAPRKQPTAQHDEP